jgi:hypothetical protein
MEPVLIALVALLGILAAANLLLTLALARRLADVERTAAAGREPRMPQVGAEVATFSVETAGGTQWTDARLRSGRTLVVFSMAGCSPCAGLAEELRQTGLPPGVGLFVLVAVASEQDRGALTAADYPVGAEVAFVPLESGLTDRFEVELFPTVVLVEEGRITAVGRKPAEVLAAFAAAPA